MLVVLLTNDLKFKSKKFCCDGWKATTFFPSFLLNVLWFSYSLCFDIPLPSFIIYWCHVHTGSLSQRANMPDNRRKYSVQWVKYRSAAACECVYIRMCLSVWWLQVHHWHTAFSSWLTRWLLPLATGLASKTEENALLTFQWSLWVLLQNSFCDLGH